MYLVWATDASAKSTIERCCLGKSYTESRKRERERERSSYNALRALIMKGKIVSKAPSLLLLSQKKKERRRQKREEREKKNTAQNTATSTCGTKHVPLEQRCVLTYIFSTYHHAIGEHRGVKRCRAPPPPRVTRRLGEWQFVECQLSDDFFASLLIERLY